MFDFVGNDDPVKLLKNTTRYATDALAEQVEASMSPALQTQASPRRNSSILQFANAQDLINLLDKKILNLNNIAWDGVRVDFRVKKVIGELPAVTVGFATNGGILYHSSSMTGGRKIFLQEPTDFDDPLNRFNVIRNLLKACRDGTRTLHN